MQSQPTRPQKVFNWLLEPALAANLAFAFVGAFLTHVTNNATLLHPLDDSTYIFLRAVFRIADLVHIPYANPVTTATVRRNYDASNKVLFAAEICIEITTLAVGALVLLLQRHALRSFRGSGVTWYVGSTALFALLLCNLSVDFHDSVWNHPILIPAAGARHFLVAVLVGELLGVCILIAVNRWRPLSFSVLSILAALHCTFWMWACWPRIRTYFGVPESPSILILAFPLSVFVWLLAFKRPHDVYSIEVQPPRYSLASQCVLATVVLSVLLLLYMPNIFAVLPGSENPSTRVIELVRGPCRGVCPSYTIRIHANGLVEYSGWRRRQGMNHELQRIDQSKWITPVEFDLAVQAIRDANLPQIEDRAFGWCFDSSSVSLAMITDHGTKRVTSDGGCFSSETGAQADFVNAAAAVDRIVRSDLWVCKEPYCY